MLGWLAASFWEAIDWLQKYNGAVTAFATFWIGIFTVVLALVSRKQAQLTRQSIELARQEFISTNRPCIILRDVHLIAETIHYTLVNLGGTPGTIITTWVFTEFVEEQNRFRPLWPTADDGDVRRLRFVGGESKDLQYALPDEMSFIIKWPKGIENRLANPGSVYFAGALVYEDDLGMKRRSRFRRRWDPKSLTFVRLSPEEERDHEYAD